MPSKQGPATAECTEDSVHSDNESLDLDRPGTPRPLDDALVVSPSASAVTDMHNEQLPRDCETLLRKGLSDTNKLDILLNFSSFNPPSSYQFPTKIEFGKNRSFQHKYLRLYGWLGYTSKLDGCLCLPCCLFGSDGGNAKIFVEKPYSNWTALNQKLKLHSTCPTHVKCSLAMKSFKDAHAGVQPTIDTTMNKHRQEQYDLNCNRLDAIIDCVVLCGKQNIALRGHRDANSQLQAQSSNQGNFKAILQFRALGDKTLQKHLTDAPKNAQYTCPDTQNEIISICKHLIWDRLSKQVAESGVYSVICDECTDSSNKEQLSLSVRYVANDQVCESFVGFFELSEGVTGRAIATTIEKALADCHLDPSKLRGQAYDGASNMSGKYKGCAAIIQQKYPLAIYSHCCSHILNLAIVQACSLIQVQNMLGIIDKVYIFFDNHPKRQYLLNTFCAAADGLSTSKLKSLCKTRWVQRIDALQIFVEMFESIIRAFDQVTTNSSDWSRDSTTDAMSLSKAMLNFEFIITLLTVERYMSFTHNLTTSLQAKAMDIMKATEHVATLRKVLTDVRSDINVQFHVLFNSASHLAEKYEVSVNTPRRCSRQTARENHPAENAEEYYRRSMAIAFLDHLVTEIDSRFTSHSIKAIRCLGIIPSCFSLEEKATDDELLEFFRSDIDSTSVAKAELDIWRSYFEGKTLPTTPKACLQHASPLLFPHIRKFLICMMVIPVTSCEAERSFSALRRIKTYLRSTMSQERLTGLALLTIHQHSSLIPSTAEIRSQFLQKNRRIMEQKLI